MQKSTKTKNSILIKLRFLRAWIRDRRQFSLQYQEMHCPICDYRGRFLSLGTPVRWHGRCPACSSRERHRLIHLFLEHENINLHDGCSILHFAPEPYFIKMMDGNSNYHTADIVPGKARHTMDMASITFPDNTFDIVISNHVLEHVDNDSQAIREVHRVLSPGGIAIITVPMNWSRNETYENRTVISSGQRYIHYGDPGHLRYYGRDVPEKLQAAGFRVDCWRLSQTEETRYGLLRDEVLWIARKTPEYA